MSRGSTAAVQGGKYLHFSVSQLQTFARCPRLWAAEKLHKLRPPQTKGQSKGDSHHVHAQNYYLHGTEHPNEAFRAALPGLPARHVDLGVELDLEAPTLFAHGVRFEGHSDLVVPPHLGKRFGVPEIHDWKFVSSFDYMEDPANALQPLLYGYWASKRWPDVRQVLLKLHYFLADGTDFKPKPAVVPIERCEAEWFDVALPRVLQMQALVAEAPAAFEATPGNFSDDYAACKKYGGCYFATKCGVAGALAARRNSVKVLSTHAAELLAAFDAGVPQ